MKEGIGITRENRNGGVPDWFIRRKTKYPLRRQISFKA